MEALPLTRPISVPTLAESVYDALLEAILSGRLESGAELSVVAVAKSLRVSRTPVHEALRRLARDGLVEQAVNRVARVARFTAADVEDIFDMRLLLEGAAAERAATRLAAAELDALGETAAGLAASRSGDWLARWVEFDEAFHQAVAWASGSPRLARDIGRYRLLHRGFNRACTNAADLQRALDEHRAILEALRAGDGHAARLAMEGHIAAWKVFLVAQFPGR